MNSDPFGDFVLFADDTTIFVENDNEKAVNKKDNDIIIIWKELLDNEM